MALLRGDALNMRHSRTKIRLFIVVFSLLLLGYGMFWFDNAYGKEKVCINAGNRGGGLSVPVVCGDKPKLTYKARLVNGKAIAPTAAPKKVKLVIAAANRIRRKPYIWGGGHGSFQSAGYDCSGAVSYALRGGKFLSSPLASGPLMSWGKSGIGKWITVYANSGHAFVLVAGLRFDTSGTGGSGPRWQTEQVNTQPYTARYPAGF
jgi:cell wall-associated NlpC family hydrolase